MLVGNCWTDLWVSEVCQVERVNKKNLEKSSDGLITQLCLLKLSISSWFRHWSQINIMGHSPDIRATKKVIREMNMAEKSIEIARDRGLATEDLLKYDVLPSPMLFDDHGLMTKPEKSQLIRELEDKLVSDDYSYHHKPESAFIIDVMATVRRVPLIGRTHFSDLLLQLTHITDVYHRYGRCDYIFDIYNDNPSVKDSERLRRCSVNPVVLSLVEQTTPLPKDMSTFWPSNKNKLLLEKLIYSYICEQSSQGHE
ncbi:hypothetical protein GQR58_005459 [Nymphon striatum]|nr:hypothetical protein GQR58_005459 [Nymphon striatum]